MPTTYRHDVAYPAELAQEQLHFDSGVNTPGDARGLVMSAHHIGITCGEIRPKLIAELEMLAFPMARLFVDSGAFSEVSFETGAPVVIEPITDAMWIERFELYAWAAIHYGRRAYVVAPDMVGNQVVTLERLRKFAIYVAVVAAHGAQIIVPVQKGAMPMSAMFAHAVEILGLAALPIAGVPMKKDATSMADLAELVGSLPWFGARVHLLGLGPKSKNFRAVIALIKGIRPNCTITSDSVTALRGQVGRTNGRGGAPRALTAAQDRARELGAKGSTEVKACALGMLGREQMRRDRDRATAAGWFDVELYDSADEAARHHAEIDADEGNLSTSPATAQLAFDLGPATRSLTERYPSTP